MKRMFDIVGGVLGLILASPLLIVIAPLVKVTSRGPLLYRQKRTGYGGNPFTIFKFRTMKWNPAAPFERCTSLRDRRLTKFGKFLKKWKLDELPQFANVLMGDMSIFGPRPYEVDMDRHFATSVFGYVVATGFGPVCGAGRSSSPEATSRMRSISTHNGTRYSS